MFTETDKLMIIMATPADTEAVLRLYREQVGRPALLFLEGRLSWTGDDRI